MTAVAPTDRACPLCCRRVQPGPGGLLPGHYSMGPGIGGWCPGPGPVVFDHFCRECGAGVAPNPENGLTGAHYAKGRQTYCTGSARLGLIVARAQEPAA